MKKLPHQNAERANVPPSRQQPFLFLNLAISADGKLATANRAIISVGSKRDLAHLYKLRATADAIMSGARTIEEAHTKLGPGGPRFQRLRLKHGLAEFALRIIVSGTASIDPNAEIFCHRFSPIILLTTARAPKARLARLRPLVEEIVISGKSEINFRAALQHLRQRWNVRHLLCEGGGEVNDALFRARLVDELHLTICPMIVGGAHAPTASDGLGVSRLAGAAAFRLVQSTRVADELFLVYRSTTGRALAKRHQKTSIARARRVTV